MYQDDTHYRYSFRLRFHLIKRIVLWTLFIGAVLGLGLKSEYDRLQQRFVTEVDRVARHGERTVKTFDVALDGFRQFLGLLPAANLEAARRYTSMLRQHYPELRLFGIAQAIDEAGRLATAANLERIGYSGLRLARFAEPGGQLAGEQAFRMPLVFTEPAVATSNELLAIDRAFNDGVRDRENPQQKRVSPTIVRHEGEQAYLLFAPIADPDRAELAIASPWQRAFALLLVHVQDLAPADVVATPGWSIRLESPGEASRPARLWWHHSDQPSRGLVSLFGAFEAERVLGGASQPLRLSFSYRPLWRDLDHQFLGLLIALVLTLVIVATRVISFSYRKNLGEVAEHSSLYQQAHYDHLTGLPNANLLMDRMERGIATLAPHERLVLVYLDLDRFKPINDRWGHDAGDAMLVEVAKRLRQQFRLEDTVSRIHGDEFIVLLTMHRDHVDEAQVAAKVRNAFAAPFELGDAQLTLGCSLGMAVYPDDAGDMETLVSVADQRMYTVKEHRYDMTPLTI